MTQDPSHPAAAGQRSDHDLSDTSSRLYTPEELGAYAERQAHAQQPPAGPPQRTVYGDPLTDPMPGTQPPADAQATPPAAPAGGGPGAAPGAAPDAGRGRGRGTAGRRRGSSRGSPGAS